ncbi:hypothetical protein K505DRAFT_216654, partial [Melanomma pulvis-pyrius CBS 109.77]
DVLNILPIEIRLMIFEDLLVVYKTVFRGAEDFGQLDKNEFQEEVPIPWQILSTCRQYHDEAAPIMYGMNRLVFCTGPSGEPGYFYHFPISTRYLQFVTDMGIYFQADDPAKQAAKRVANFIKALIKYATKLENLVVLASSDRWYKLAECHWDILWCDHPVSKQLVCLIKSKIVTNLKLRFHDGAVLYQMFGRHLEQLFRTTGSTQGRSIVFTWSCACPINSYPYPIGNPSHGFCVNCSWPRQHHEQKPIEVVVYPMDIETDQERLMALQAVLFSFGLLPQKNDNEEEEEEE